MYLAVSIDVCSPFARACAVRANLTTHVTWNANARSECDAGVGQVTVRRTRRPGRRRTILLRPADKKKG